MYCVKNPQSDLGLNIVVRTVCEGIIFENMFLNVSVAVKPAIYVKNKFPTEFVWENQPSNCKQNLTINCNGKHRRSCRCLARPNESTFVCFNVTNTSFIMQHTIMFLIKISFLFSNQVCQLQIWKLWNLFIIIPALGNMITGIKQL